MNITNAKGTFITKLFGKKGDRFRQNRGLDHEAPITEAQATPQPGMVQNFLQSINPPNYSGNVPTGSVPAPPVAPVQGAAQEASRYQMMEMSDPMPERDTAQEEILKKRAKMNAFGKGISALAGLAGVASGGDAPVVPDAQTPWNLAEFQKLGTDQQARLQDWTDRKFRVDAANTLTKNNEIDQNIDSENRMQQINQQGQNAQQLAAQRAQADMEKLGAMDATAQAKEMRSIGVDINSENAQQEYLKRRTNQYKAGLSNKSGGSQAKGLPYEIGVYQKGRDKKLSQINAQIQQIESNSTMSFMQKEAMKAPLLEEQSFYSSKYNPNSNELIDNDIIQLGLEEDGGQGQTRGPGSPQISFDQNRGLTNIQGNQDPLLTPRLTDGFKKASNGMLEEADFNQLIQDLIASGDAQDEESAYAIIEEYMNKDDQ